MVRPRISVTWPMGSEARAIGKRVGAQATGPTELARSDMDRAARVACGDAILSRGALTARERAVPPASLDLDPSGRASHVGSVSGATRRPGAARAAERGVAARDGRRPPHLVTSEAWRTT